MINGSLVNPSLRKAVAASLPHAKVLRGLKKLGVSSPKRR
ncbi:phthiodiolone/phenolphthiodiolone dimycocerosates ketoreductase domain protein [Mycobacterium kansasii 824]|nr:phthiodiolone/phenolphthiodiolone dimycocerosates ketoreductase domain protein [Mycobacterium kansasii 824]